MIWWYWLVLGLVLLGLELATPGGLLALFFGIGALVVGILSLLGIAGPTWLQWVLFSLLSIASLILLRGPLQARLNVGRTLHPVDSLAGETAIVVEEIPAGGVGKVELRGASWSARSEGPGLVKGQRCRVDRLDGLMVWVRSE